jgi:hypothetical protein
MIERHSNLPKRSLGIIGLKVSLSEWVETNFHVLFLSFCKNFERRTGRGRGVGRRDEKGGEGKRENYQDKKETDKEKREEDLEDR